MKKRQVVLYVVVMLILLTTSVYATIVAELDFKIHTNNGTIFYAGDEFTMTIGLKNVEASEGIKSIEGYIDIDERIFENLTLDSIVTNSNGKVQIGNNELQVYDANDISSTNTDKGVIFNTNPVSGRGDYKLVINLENPITSNQDLVELKFKIKDNVAAGSYQSVMSYKLFNVFAIDAGEKLELDGQSYGIEISSRTPVENNTTNDTPKDNTTNDTPKDNTTNDTPKANTNTDKPKSDTTNTPKGTESGTTGGTTNTAGGQIVKPANKTDDTVSPTNLPKTGYRLILIPIIVMAVIGYVFYKKYSKYNIHE